MERLAAVLSGLRLAMVTCMMWTASFAALVWSPILTGCLRSWRGAPQTGESLLTCMPPYGPLSLPVRSLSLCSA